MVQRVGLAEEGSCHRKGGSLLLAAGPPALHCTPGPAELVAGPEAGVYVFASFGKAAAMAEMRGTGPSGGRRTNVRGRHRLRTFQERSVQGWETPLHLSQ